MATQAIQFDFSKRLTAKRKQEFAEVLKALSNQIGFKVSSRGWCYIMEQKGIINKNQFDRIDDAINDCRRKGYLPVDFVAEESARQFNGVEPLEGGDKTMEDVLQWMLRDVLDGSRYFQPEWWENEEYYIQIIVEKIDLIGLFEPICKEYKIPIANAKGWSSILQRAEYCRRYKQAEEMGLQCVLLYCGDHDPDGGRISDTLRANLEQISEIVWGDGTEGWDPANLIIDRFGLNFDYIEENNLTSIDNLITGNVNKKMDLSDPHHPNHNLTYVQEYISNYGVRKWESNAIVVTPVSGRRLLTQSIEKYLGTGADKRFAAVRQQVKKDYAKTLKDSNLAGPIGKFLGYSENEMDELLNNGNDEDEVDEDDE